MNLHSISIKSILLLFICLFIGDNTSYGIILNTTKLKIANDGTVSYSYDTGASDDVANTVIYVPANSTADNYQYKIRLVDGDNTANSLVPTASSTLSNSLTAGRAWVMFATPNPTKFNDAHKILLTSSGTQCKTKNSDTSVSIIPTSCDTNREKW